MKCRGVLRPAAVVLLVLLLRARAVTLRDERAAEGRDIVMRYNLRGRQPDAQGLHMTIEWNVILICITYIHPLHTCMHILHINTYAHTHIGTGGTDTPTAAVG